jgi:hypothetical protein
MMFSKHLPMFEWPAFSHVRMRFVDPAGKAEELDRLEQPQLRGSENNDALRPRFFGQRIFARP